MELLNDDVAERRNSQMMSRALAQSSISSTSRVSDSSNETEMRTHLKTCLKLYMDNKINSKNVWQLKVITYLHRLLKEEDIFQLACSMLEVAAKIFSVKVDDLHVQIINSVRDLRRLVNKGVDRNGKLYLK